MKHPRMTLGIKFLEGRAQKVKLALSYSILRKNLEIDSIIIHPDYAPSSSSSYIESDIALLKLKAPLDLDKYVPACLPEWNRTFVGMTAWIYGWGRFIGRRRGPLSNILRQTTGQVISEQICWTLAASWRWTKAIGQRVSVHFGRASPIWDPSRYLRWRQWGTCDCSTSRWETTPHWRHQLQFSTVWRGKISSKICSPFHSFDFFFQPQADVHTDVSIFRNWIDREIEKHGEAKFCV